MKSKKQILSFLLAIFMIAPSILNIVHAESIEPNTNTAEDSYASDQAIENTELLPQSDEESISSPGIIGEDVTKRDAFSKHYLRTDGTYIAITGAEAIHYQTDSGSWEEIDNSLVLDSSSGYYENANSESGFDIAFSNDASKEEAVMIKDGENSISWYIEALSPNGSKNNASKSAKVKVKNNNANANARINGKGGKENSSISYSDIFGTDIGATLRYSVSENRIEEDIIFERVPEISAYTMNIKAPGMEATLNSDGSVEIIAKNGKAAYTVKAPIMYDSDGVYSADIEVSVERHGNIIKITYAPDMDWLRDESRAYPVTLDPIVETSQYTSNIVDTYVAENISADFSNQANLLSGYTGLGHTVSYIDFVEIPAPFIDDLFYIDSAELLLFESGVSEFDKSSTLDVTYQYVQNKISYLSLGVVTSDWTPNSIIDSRPSQYIAASSYDISYDILENYIYDEDESVYVDVIQYSFDFSFEISDALMDSGGFYNDSDWDYYWNYCKGFSINYDESGNQLYNFSFFSSEYATQSLRPMLRFSYSVDDANFYCENGVYNFKNIGMSQYLDALGTDISTSYSKFYLDSLDSGYRIRTVYDDDENDEYILTSSANGTSAWFSTNLTMNNTTQSWFIIPVSSSQFIISYVYNPQKVLTAFNESEDSYTIGMSDYTGSNMQKWEIYSGGQKYYTSSINVRNVSTNNERYEKTSYTTLFCPVTGIYDNYVELSTSNAYVAPIAYNSAVGMYVVNSLRAGTAVISFDIYDEYDSEPVDVVQFNILVKKDNDVYKFNNVLRSNYYVELKNGNIEESVAYIQSETENDRNSQFKITHIADGKYSIRSMQKSDMGLYAMVDGQSNYRVVNKSIGDTSSDVPKEAQWRIEAAKNGSYILINVKYPAYAISVPSSDEDGTDLTSIVKNKTDDDQCWTMTRIYSIQRGIDIRKGASVIGYGQSVELYATLYSDSDTMNSQSIEWIFTDTASSAHATITNHGNGRATLTSTGTTFYSSLKLRAQSTETVSSYYRKDIEVDVSALNEDNYYIQNKVSSLYTNPDNDGEDHLEQFEFNGTGTAMWTFVYCKYEDFPDYYYIKNGDNYIFAPDSNIANTTLKYGALPEDKTKARWKVTLNSEGEYLLQAQSWINNGRNLYMGVNALSDNGFNVRQESSNNADRNVWKIASTLRYAHLVLPARIYYDSSANSAFTEEQMVEAYIEATDYFWDEYYIKFEFQYIDYSSELNFNSSLCHSASYQMCTSECGSLSTCNSTHHKGAKRLLTLLSSDDYYTCRIINYRLCYDDTIDGHIPVKGLGDVNGNNIIVTANNMDDLIQLIKHELIHNFGATHTSCDKDVCFMEDDEAETLCADCDSKIKEFWER